MTTIEIILCISSIFMVGHVSGWYRGKAVEREKCLRAIRREAMKEKMQTLVGRALPDDYFDDNGVW